MVIDKITSLCLIIVLETISAICKSIANLVNPILQNNFDIINIVYVY